MSTLARWTAVVGGVVAVAATAAPAHASFLQEPGSPFTLGTAPYGVVTADFNRDGRPDVATVNGTSSDASILLRQPGGGFVQETGSPFGVAGGPSYGTVADFNGDGWPDLAVAGFSGAAVSVHRRLPGGGFVADPDKPIPTTRAGAVAAGDFNGDGRPDLAVAKWDTGELMILLRQGGQGGTFVEEALPAPKTNGVHPRYIATADFNGDGLLDLAVSNVHTVPDGTVAVLLRKSGGGFVNDGAPITVGKFPVALVATDLDGDSRPDIAVVNSESDSVSILIRQAAGGFVRRPDIPVGDAPLGITAGDFNGDNLRDLAVTNHDSDTVSVLLRTPAGGYEPDAGTPVLTGDGPNQITATDFNGDGKLDLAVTNDGAGTLTVLRNTTPDPTAPQTPGAPVPGPGPGPGPTPPPPTPSINARLVLTWTITKRDVRLNSATLHDLPAGGATVKIACKPCKVSQTLTAKKATLSLRKLVNKRLKRGTTFTVAITKPGWNGLTFTRKVKQYGRTRKALRKAVKAPFSEKRRCVPLAKGTKC